MGTRGRSSISRVSFLSKVPDTIHPILEVNPCITEPLKLETLVKAIQVYLLMYEIAPANHNFAWLGLEDAIISCSDVFLKIFHQAHRHESWCPQEIPDIWIVQTMIF